MGCANTKVPQDVVEGNHDYETVVIVQEKVQNALPAPHDEPHVDISEIQELLHQLKDLKDELKFLIYEKYGVQRSVDIIQRKLLELSTEQTNSKNKYQNLLTKVVEKDVEELYRGLNSSTVDKRILIEVLTARPRWHITMIAETYERQYNVPLFLQIREKVTSQFGKLIGSKTGLSKLLEYMTTDQPERDGKFLQLAINELDFLLEIIYTRSNHQLHSALNDYELRHGKHFLDALKGNVSGPCFAFLSEVCVCRRDETGFPLNTNVAESTALELQQAIISKNHDLCAQILVNLSDLQIGSIVREYNRISGPNGNKNLDQDISNAFSGDYRTTLRAKCMEKYLFLASHIHHDKETICRILGSLSRRDCKLLRSAYDANKNLFGGKSFTDMLHEEIKKESYLSACLNLVSADTSSFPLGVDREPSEDTAEVESIGENAYRAAKETYSQQEMQTIGASESSKFLHEVNLSIPSLPNRPTSTQLSNLAVELEENIHDTENQIKELHPEIEQVRDLLFTVTQQCAQTEKWNRIYKAYSASLRQHLDRSGVPDIPGPSPSPKKK